MVSSSPRISIIKILMQLSFKFTRVHVSLTTFSSVKTLPTCGFYLQRSGNLQSCFSKRRPMLKALEQPYTEPHEILDRGDKTVTLQKPTKVSTDSVKPAFIVKEVPASVPAAPSVPTNTPFPISTSPLVQELRPVPREDFVSGMF
ncbi:hypothetical protein J6590_059249 [Homalodisca vitripennis]|nr:hypothetical protein J6590_059249 [Homalodisca vitripennis]